MTEAEWLACEDPETMVNRLLHYVQVPFARMGVPKASDRKLRLFAEACALFAGRSPDLIAEVSRGFHDDDMATWAMAWASRVEGAPSATLPQAAKAALLREVVGNPWRPVTLSAARQCRRSACRQTGADFRHTQTGDYYCRKCALAINRHNPDLVLMKPEDSPCPWLTPTVLAIAEQVYESRAFEELPILADALEDAGCPGTEVCSRCKGKGELVPGPYWARVANHCDDCNGTGRVPNPILAHLRIQPTPPGEGHSSRCGTAFRGCAPECPKEQWERNGPHVRGCWCLDLLLGKS